ncbi:hypothetical protein WAK64_05565 [Bacillus spongiae]|uniref:Uncharacterized protein n=1 Tax=Bacillus spongiae TaxID=2683610 RepID=A0ABU8HBG7_9BACI
MVFRLFLLLLGFGLAVSGGVSLIVYLNLLTTGLSVQQFIDMMKMRMEGYLFIIGTLFITLAIYLPTSKDKHK